MEEAAEEVDEQAAFEEAFQAEMVDFHLALGEGDGARLLTHNLGTAIRQTTGRWRPLLWVYGRSGRPCLKCRTPIRGSRLHGRRTAWCPACQSRPSAA